MKQFFEGLTVGVGRLPALAYAAFVCFALACALRADPVTVQVHPAPALASGVWVNGAPTTLAAQRGKVTVLLFWTRDCINCKHNLGYWNDWAKTYRGTDVSVISVHTPETRYERSVDVTRRFASQHGLQFPILVDNDEKTWNAFRVESWPTEILIDKRGQVRAEYAGELNWQGSGEYKTVQAKIEQLRREQTASR